MTIECQESLLFVLRTKVRTIPPETEEVLERMSTGRRPADVIGRSLIVETPDRVVVRFHGDIFIDDTVYEREAINAAHITPKSLSDLVKQRRYYWRP